MWQTFLNASMELKEEILRILQFQSGLNSRLFKLAYSLQVQLKTQSMLLKG